MELYDKLFEQAFFELGEAFSGLADENVWKRPADGLLSVGELAGHLAFGGIAWLAGGDGHTIPDGFDSPLLDPRFRYYPHTLASSPSEAQLALNAEQVLAELLRLLQSSWKAFQERSPDLDACPEGQDMMPTFRHLVRYQTFHLPYHTGQIYAARHLLGETPPDN